MPTLDDMFGKPKEHAVGAPVDVLPDTHATSQAGTFDKAAGRDIMLVASPFEAEVMDFFNRESEKVTLESDRPLVTQLDSDVVFAPRSDGSSVLADSLGAALDNNDVVAGTRGLAEALGPSIENLSTFGEFGGGLLPSSEMDISQLREALRAVLARL